MEKMTKKQLNYKYDTIIRVGYCGLQNLLSADGVRKVGYNNGIYGWNWTAYELTNNDGKTICVCTGYRAMTGKKLDGVTQFEENAKNVYYNYSLKYDERQKQLETIKNDFIDFVLQNYNND